MARNRQRAKQRQAERRARRLAEERPSSDAGRPRAAERELADPTAVEPSPAVDPDLAVGAPPQEEGRSDTVFEEEPALDEGRLSEDEVEEAELEEAELEQAEEEELEPESLRELEEAELGAPGDGGDGADAYAPRARRREAAAPAKDRPRFIQFLVAVWAELQRVQWPNRQALVTLTGVVLGFVLIAGGYLGLLDAIFSRVIEAIL